jgi:hypothetical protein
MTTRMFRTTLRNRTGQNLAYSLWYQSMSADTVSKRCTVTARPRGTARGDRVSDGTGRNQTIVGCGSVVQLVRTPACHTGGRGIESSCSRQFPLVWPGDIGDHRPPGPEPRITSLMSLNKEKRSFRMLVGPKDGPKYLPERIIEVALSC